MPTQGDIIKDLAEKLTALLIIEKLEECKTIEDVEKLKDELKVKYSN